MKRLLLVLLLTSLPVMAQTSAPQVAFTGWVGPGGVFPLFNHGTVVMASDADRTLAYPEMSASVIVITSSVSLTTTRNVINPSNTLGFLFSIENSTTGGQSIVIKGNSGTGVTIANGRTVTVMSDGTNYVRVGVDPFKHNAFGGATPIDSFPTWPNSVNEDGGLTGANNNPATFSVSEQPNLAWSSTLTQHTGILSMPNYISKVTGGGNGTGVWGDASVDASSTAAMSIWGVSGTADDYSNAGSAITNQYVEGLYGAAYHNGNTTTTFLMGTDSNAVQAGSGTVQNLIGVSGQVNQNSGSGTVLKALAGNFGANIGGTTTTLYGVWTGGGLTGSASVGTYFANYVQKLNVGTGSTVGNAYSFVSEPGAGSMGINTTTPSADLEVVGTGKFTNIVTGGCSGCPGMVWPTSGPSVAVYNGSNAWTAGYNASNPIPANYIANPLTQNTSGNAATATALAANGVANQVWGMNTSGTTQGWQTSVSNPVTFPVHSPPLSTTGTYAVTASDFLICATIPVSASSPTIQLPATTPPNGQCIVIVNYGTGAPAIARAGTQTINGAAANITLQAGSSNTPTAWKIVSDGTNFVGSKDFGGSFAALTSGTSVGAGSTFTIGNGSSLTFTTGGTVNANQLLGTAVPTLASGFLQYTSGTGFAWSAAAGMVWPGGSTVGVIPNYNGANGWGSSYGAANPIPFNFLATTVSLTGACGANQYMISSSNTGPSCGQVNYSQIGGTVPNAPALNTNGSANQVWAMNAGATAQGWVTPSTTATAMSTSGTANQVWGMDSAGVNQGWQTASSGGPAYTQVFSNIAMSTTAGPLQVTGTGCATTTPWACTIATPTSGDASYRLNGTITQTVQGVGCATPGSLQFWISYTDADSGAIVTNSASTVFSLGATALTVSMSMGNGALGTTSLWNIQPLNLRVRNNTSLTFRTQQSVALGSGCTTTPTFTMRIAAYTWP